MQLKRKYILLAMGGFVAMCFAAVPVGIRLFDCFAPSVSTGTEPETIKLCEEHDLATSLYPFCNPGVIESSGICSEHGVPEALCHRCRPELESIFRKQGDWCAGHNVPESQCQTCNPGILDKYLKQADPVAALDQAPNESVNSSFFDDFDTQQPFPRYKRRPTPGCTTQDQQVRFPDSQIPSQIGIEIEPAVPLAISPELSCDATTDYDRSSYTQVSTPAVGIIRQIKTEIGRKVNKGDVLAVIDSKEFGLAKTAFLEANVRAGRLAIEYERDLRLYEKNITSQKDMLESKTRVEESHIQLSGAKQYLKNLGLTEVDIERVKKEKDTSSLLVIESPITGVVVKQIAVVGELAYSMPPLFEVAATEKMWVLLNVYEPNLTIVALGQKVAVTLSGLEGNTWNGAVSWVSTAIDPVTRSLQVRVDVDNSDGRIKAGMFGSALIQLDNTSQKVGIPKDALQWDGCCNMVFIRLSDRVYAPRKVKIDYRTGDYYAVASGVSPGEMVVTQGSFLLKTEILKGNIGAGCCPDA